MNAHLTHTNESLGTQRRFGDLSFKEKFMALVASERGGAKLEDYMAWIEPSLGQSSEDHKAQIERLMTLRQAEIDEATKSSSMLPTSEEILKQLNVDPKSVNERIADVAMSKIKFP